MQQGEELRHDTFYLIGHEYLVAVELDLVLLQFNVRLNLREIEDTREVEGIVDVEVDPEQRLVAHGVEGAVERLVVLVLQRAWGLGPQGLYIIDDIVLVLVDHLFLFAAPLLFLAEGHRYSHELAVFLEQTFELVLVEELLAVVVDIEDDIRTTVLALGIVDLVGRRAVAAPLYGL